MSPDQKPATIWDGVPLALCVILIVGLIVGYIAITDSSLVHLCDRCYHPMKQGKKGWWCHNGDCRRSVETRKTPEWAR